LGSKTIPDGKVSRAGVGVASVRIRKSARTLERSMDDGIAVEQKVPAAPRRMGLVSSGSVDGSNAIVGRYRITTFEFWIRIMPST